MEAKCQTCVKHVMRLRPTEQSTCLTPHLCIESVHDVQLDTLHTMCFVRMLDPAQGESLVHGSPTVLNLMDRLLKTMKATYTTATGALRASATCFTGKKLHAAIASMPAAVAMVLCRHGTVESDHTLQ